MKTKNNIFHKVQYNSQRDNFNFKGKFMGGSQCFSTCAWMFMSYFSPSIKANDDKALSIYVDDVEAFVGGKGIAEKIIKKYNWITGKTSLWWLVQQAGIEKWLKDFKVKGKVVFSDLEYDFDNLKTLLEKSPVILGTNKIGGVRGGHIILVVGYNDNYNNFIVNDPYGDAKTKYKDHNGENVEYSYDFLKKYALYDNKIRCMYLDK